MTDQKDGRSQTSPSRDAEVKGGQHSHGGTNPEKSQPDQSPDKQRQPSQEESTRGGQHSQSGNKR